VVRIIRRTSPPGGDAPAATLSAPPPATPIEVGLVLRSAREKAGLSLESVRSSTGVPMVDLAALEQGHLAVLHVEQAAVVGLWRYAELLGLDPAPLVAVIRASWPHPALAVDAMHGDPHGTGMPCALLAEAEGLLMAIASRAAERGGVLAARPELERPLGLSASTRRQLASGGARNVLTSTALVPTSKQSAGALRPRVDDAADAAAEPAVAVAEAAEAEPAEPADAPASGAPDRPTAAEAAEPADAPVGAAPDGPTPDRAVRDSAVLATGGPPPEAPPARDVASFPPMPLTAKTTGADGAADGVATGTMTERPRRWPGQLLHVVAERFGLDEPDGEGPRAGPVVPQAAAPHELVPVDLVTGEMASPTSSPSSAPPPISSAHA